jgi:L-amino acid N-acyltransferase YncA
MGCCWLPGSMATRSATGTWRASRPRSPRSAATFPGRHGWSTWRSWGRSRGGIGTALIRAAEEAARRLGHQRVALAVGVDNPDARRLYERLGYADWGHGTIVGTWQDHDRDGPPVTVSETCDVLAKRL